MDARVQKWVCMGLRTEIIPNTLVAEGVAETKEKANFLAEKMIEEVEEECKRGLVPIFPMRVMMGRNPL
jgi:hypothetical protein